MNLFDRLVRKLVSLLVRALALLGKGIAYCLGALWRIFPASWRDRVAEVQFRSWLALGFATTSYFYPLVMGLFWLVVFLFVELGYWDEYRDKAKGWLLMGGQPKVADAWGEFASKTDQK